MNEEFISTIRENVRDLRRAGTPARCIRMSAAQAKLIEGEFAVEHHDGLRWIENTKIVEDESVPFGEFRLY